MKRLLNILLWSVIAAAFIGPGTITTAARAGSDFRFALAWALLFSIIACLILQEASGRITVLTGKELGGAIRGRLVGRSADVSPTRGGAPPYRSWRRLASSSVAWPTRRGISWVELPGCGSSWTFRPPCSPSLPG